MAELSWDRVKEDLYTTFTSGLQNWVDAETGASVRPTDNYGPGVTNTGAGLRPNGTDGTGGGPVVIQQPAQAMPSLWMVAGVLALGFIAYRMG